MNRTIDEDEIDLKELLKTVRKHAKKIFFFALLFALAATWYAYLSPNIYKASTTLEIGEQKSNNISQDDMLSMAMNAGIANSDTEIEILKSRYLVSKALKKVNFTHRYYAKYHFKERELYEKSPFDVIMNKGKGYFFNIEPVDSQYYRVKSEGINTQTLEEWSIDKVYEYGEVVKEKNFDFTLYLKNDMELQEDTVYGFMVLDDTKAAQEVQENLSVQQTMKGSTILEISYVDNVALRAEQFLNALTQAYLTQEIEQKTEEASMILAFIDKQLAGVNSNLQDSEKNLEHFKQKSNMMSLGSKAEGVVSKMSEYEGKLAEANIEEQMLSTLYAQIKAGKNFETISAAGLNLAKTGVPQLIQKLQEAVLKRKVLRADYTSVHPEVKKLTQSIIQFKKVIASTIRTLKTRVSKRKALLKKTITKYNTLMESLPEKEKVFGGLQRKFIVNEKIYSYLLEKRATTAIAKASTVNKSRVIDKALVPQLPIKPKRKLIILVGIIVGFIFGIAFAFIREFMDDRIREEEDIHRLSSLPVMGSIPFIKKDSDSIKVFNAPKSVVSEAFRSVRTNLQFMSKNEDTMLITLTSTVSGEGKTTVATNLSAIISLTGKKTIVLNMDMRKPMLHTKFSLPNNQGMSTLLSGKADINDVIQETDYENLDIISSGPIPPNPSELIGGENMLKVIESLKSEYDVIIFDTPPIGLVTDAMVLMRMSDVTLYVLRSEYSKKTYLVDIQRMMDEHQVKGFTLLLNGIKANKEGYGYGYGYGHGYYEEN